jgi:hypothetical protein
MSDSVIPPTSEICSRKELANRHPHILSEHRVAWALRNRSKNGLSACRAVFESPCGQLFVREPAFLAWFLGLDGRAKPRAVRNKRSQNRGIAPSS